MKKLNKLGRPIGLDALRNYLESHRLLRVTTRARGRRKDRVRVLIRSSVEVNGITTGLSYSSRYSYSRAGVLSKSCWDNGNHTDVGEFLRAMKQYDYNHRYISKVETLLGKKLWERK